MARIYHQDNTVPDAGEMVVWVFGSNLAGSHGGGAARVASDRFCAVHGVGRGRTGRAYALPTNDKYGDRLDLEQIHANVDTFLAYARHCPDEHFWVTRVGCGIAGNRDQDIAPLFANAPANCSLPDTWKNLLGD